jgi:hypothetical protein
MVGSILAKEAGAPRSTGQACFKTLAVAFGTMGLLTSAMKWRNTNGSLLRLIFFNFDGFKLRKGCFYAAASRRAFFRRWLTVHLISLFAVVAGDEVAACIDLVKVRLSLGEWCFSL